jgi:tight adherence protein B
LITSSASTTTTFRGWFTDVRRERVLHRRRHPTETLGNDDLSDALASIARSLRSGQSLSAAIVASTKHHPTDVTRFLGRRLAADVALSEACREMLRNENDRDAVMTLHVLGLCASTGGDIASTIDSLVVTLDERAHARAERRAQAATALASTRLITWLPIGCGVFIMIDDANVRHVLFATPLGWICVGIGVGLNLLGRRWTRHLVESS